MRDKHKPTLATRWYTGPDPGFGWRALEAVYRGVVAMRLSWYRRGWLRSKRLPVPVIVVGNITVGGSGKTPLVIALVEALREGGFRPGVVSRGYGGTAAAPELLGADADPMQHGDEPCLIRQRCRVPVAVGRDRVAAARLLLHAGVDLIISDDGLQHYRLARDLEICVIDGVRRFGNGRMLPAGPLREPLSRLGDVDIRVSNGGHAELGEVQMRLRGDVACALHNRDQCIPLADFAARRVHAIAGIGHPPRFFASLRAHGIEVMEHAFADHHQYVVDDLAFAHALPVLMTEKDAIKCEHFDLPDAWVVPVRAELPPTLIDDVAERLRSKAQQEAGEECRLP